MKIYFFPFSGNVSYFWKSLLMYMESDVIANSIAHIHLLLGTSTGIVVAAWFIISLTLRWSTAMFQLTSNVVDIITLQYWI